MTHIVENDDLYEMDLRDFSSWLDMYPFIRTLIRESMMPKMWTLNREYAIKQSTTYIKPLIFSGNVGYWDASNNEDKSM